MFYYCVLKLCRVNFIDAYKTVVCKVFRPLVVTFVFPHSQIIVPSTSFPRADLIFSQKFIFSVASTNHSTYVFLFISIFRLLDIMSSGRGSNNTAMMRFLRLVKPSIRAICSSNSHHSLLRKLLLSIKTVRRLFDDE